jgi:hypothetical protein
VDEAMRTAGCLMLEEIAKRRVECVGERNIAVGEARYILGLILQLSGEHARAVRLMEEALEVCA